MRITLTRFTSYMNRHTYNPPGVCKAPISLRLMPEELAEVDAIAAAKGITRSKLLREAHLKGLPLVVSDLSSSADAPSQAKADLSGGEVTPLSAGLSTLAA